MSSARKPPTRDAGKGLVFRLPRDISADYMLRARCIHEMHCTRIGPKIVKSLVAEIYVRRVGEGEGSEWIAANCWRHVPKQFRK